MASVGKMRTEGGTLPPFPEVGEWLQACVPVAARVEGRFTGVERAEQGRDGAK